MSFDYVNLAECILAGISALISVIAIFYARKSNCISRESNKKADEANEIATQSLEEARKANRIADHSLNVSMRNSMSRFDVKLKRINFTNDAFKCESIEDAMEIGVVNCVFSIKNISCNDAFYVGFEKIQETTGLRSRGETIKSNSASDADLFFQFHEIANSEPEYDVTIGKEMPCRKKIFKHTAYLKWDNGTYSCSCDVVFRFCIEEYVDDGKKQCRVYPDVDAPAETLNYMTNDFS